MEQENMEDSSSDEDNAVPTEKTLGETLASASWGK
jgi:hypothetical protein